MFAQKIALGHVDKNRGVKCMPPNFMKKLERSGLICKWIMRSPIEPDGSAHLWRNYKRYKSE